MSELTKREKAHIDAATKRASVRAAEEGNRQTRRALTGDIHRERSGKLLSRTQAEAQLKGFKVSTLTAYANALAKGRRRTVITAGRRAKALRMRLAAGFRFAKRVVQPARDGSDFMNRIIRRSVPEATRAAVAEHKKGAAKLLKGAVDGRT